MILITSVHMDSTGIQTHEHIESVAWRNPETSATGTSTVAEIIEFIEKGGSVKVSAGGKTVDVGAVRPNRPGKPHIRTHADGEWSNNLLSLPRY